MTTTKYPLAAIVLALLFLLTATKVYGGNNPVTGPEIRVNATVDQADDFVVVSKGGDPALPATNNLATDLTVIWNSVAAGNSYSVTVRTTSTSTDNNGVVTIDTGSGRVQLSDTDSAPITLTQPQTAIRMWGRSASTDTTVSKENAYTVVVTFWKNGVAQCYVSDALTVMDGVRLAFSGTFVSPIDGAQEGMVPGMQVDTQTGATLANNAPNEVIVADPSDETSRLSFSPDDNVPANKIRPSPLDAPAPNVLITKVVSIVPKVVKAFTSYAVSAPESRHKTVVSATNHGLSNGDVIRIETDTTTESRIVGTTHCIDDVTANSFSIPVNTETGPGGGSGTFSKGVELTADALKQASVALTPPTASININSNTSANPTVITSASAHGLRFHGRVNVTASGGSDPSIVGIRKIPVTPANDTTFPVSLSVSTAGGAGSFTTLGGYLAGPNYGEHLVDPIIRFKKTTMTGLQEYLSVSIQSRTDDSRISARIYSIDKTLVPVQNGVVTNTIQQSANVGQDSDKRKLAKWLLREAPYIGPPNPTRTKAEQVEGIDHFWNFVGAWSNDRFRPVELNNMTISVGARAILGAEGKYGPDRVRVEFLLGQWDWWKLSGQLSNGFLISPQPQP